MRGRVSGLPVERYIGLERGMGLPVMVCRDQGNRHWITDGTRSALIFPPERDVDEFDSKRYIFDYSIDRAEELLSVVDPNHSRELSLRRVGPCELAPTHRFPVAL